MAELGYPDMPDTQKQHIDETVKIIREYMTWTLNSFTKSAKTVKGGQQGFQLPFWITDYGQNSYLTPGASGNSYAQPIPPTTQSMWVGLSFQAAALFTDGFFLDTMDMKESLISEGDLRELKMKNFLKHQNYYSIGDNYGYGILAVTTSNTGGTFTGTTAAQLTAGYTKGAHRLIKGVTYDIVDESSFAVVGTMTPTANGTNSATVTCTTTGSPDNSGAFVVEQGAFNKVPRGLAYLINNNARIFQGLDTTGIKEFQSSVVDLNGSALTSATINTLKTKVQVRIGAENNDSFSKICHTTPGQYNTLAIQGYGARQYQAANGQATTSYGEPNKYVDGDTMWIADPDIDEDRVYLRRASDYFKFELTPLGPVNRDGLKMRQAPGLNDVGANAWFSQIEWNYNLGFDGGGTGGNDASAFIQRAAVVTSQVNAAS